LDLEEVAHEIYKCILAWLSEGQSLIPLSLCQSQVVNIVWNVYCKGYDNLHQFDREEVSILILFHFGYSKNFYRNDTLGGILCEESKFRIHEP
jgi:hypothetical protein